MEYTPKEYCIRIWGDYACFTRPEMKVERVSYDVITPSAARNIFQAIFWKPAFNWVITRIEVVNPIKKASIRRNEIDKLMNPNGEPLIIENQHTQRTAYLLKDVCYRIFAKQIFIPMEQRTAEQQAKAENPEAETPRKYEAMFERRIQDGQCFAQPYLGCREFTGLFEYEPDAEYCHGTDDTRSLGYMLYDLDFDSNPRAPKPMFFEAQMEHGVISIPDPITEPEKILR